MPNDLIAWAAGLYDGDGSASMYVPRQRKTARRQMQVSQGGVPGIQPAVLVRFREIVREGNITGPYGGDLYYWKTMRKDAVDEIARTLWPPDALSSPILGPAVELRWSDRGRPACSTPKGAYGSQSASGIRIGADSQWIYRSRAKSEYPTR